MPRQSPSISSWSESRHACSCGEATSTPSTSKMAPSKPSGISDLLLLATGSGGCIERERAIAPGEQLSGLAPDRDLDPLTEPLIGDAQLSPCEAQADRRAAELHAK